MPILVLFFVVGIPLLIWVVATFNTLVRLRQHCKESWASIDTELKRRYDLIPNLVSTVKGYAAHEKEVLESVTQARTRAVDSTGSPGSQAVDENSLIGALEKLLVVVEAYPQLKASEAFLDLHRELVVTEDRIQAARRFYNGNVRDLNTRVEMVPSCLIAQAFGFQQEEFYEVKELQVREAPPVEM